MPRANRLPIVLTEEYRAKFYAKVCLTPTTTHEDCWLWAGARDGFGYGHFKIGRRSLKAHRVAWVAHTGIQIPDDKVIDHLCRNRLCVNPRHLELVTDQENTLRGVGPSSRLNAARVRKTHCANGHALVEIRRRRMCVICTKRKADETRRKKLAAFRAIVPRKKPGFKVGDPRAVEAGRQSRKPQPKGVQ